MRNVLSYLGYLLILSGLLRIVPVIVALSIGEEYSRFVWGIAINILAGIAFLAYGTLKYSLSLRPKADELSMSQSLVLSVLFFAFVSLLGSFAYFPFFSGSGAEVFVNSLFESVSGFTTTGLTAFSTVNHLPISLRIWRAETQWIGGLGIITLFVFFLRRDRGDKNDIPGQQQGVSTMHALYQAQGLGEKIEASFSKSAARILRIYIAYTLVGVLALAVLGMGWLESLGTVFASVSTGGFTMSDNLALSPSLAVALMFLMLLGSTSLVVHSLVFRGRFREALRNRELRLFFALVAFALLVSWLFFPHALFLVFHFVSALTTTGFSLVGVNVFPPLVFLLLVGFMIIGGSQGSTAGGIKLGRLIVGMKGVQWAVRKLGLPPKAVVPFKLNGEAVDKARVIMAHVFIVSYLVFFVAGALLLAASGFTLRDAVFLSASSIGTVGLSTTDISQAALFPKLVMIVQMFLGRLEIFPVLVFFRSLLR